ncbi:condensation domain-containing protein, partial [Burkholderia stagnalis]
HMVPAAYVRLPGMPLTPNGKLDRKALPAPDGQAYARQVYEAPREGTEASLARIWEAVLQVDRVGRHDNFFELGGNSLLAIGLLSHMRKEGLAADVRALFNAPTLAALAQAVGGGSVQLIEVPPNAIPPHSDTITPAMLPLVELTEQDIASIVATVPGGAANVQDIYPLAPLQEGILFHHRLGGEGDVYLLPALFGLASRTRLDRFIDALQQVVDRHDILRTAVVWEGTAEPVQVVLRQVALPVEEIEFDPAQGALADQMSARFDPVRYRIDVSQAPLLRCHVTYDKARGRWLLHILVHHLAFDRRTLELLVQEARAIEEGRTQALTVPVPFRNFVAHTRLGVSRREHEAFFREMLADIDAPTAPFGLYEVQGDGSDIEEATHMLSPELASEVRQSVRRLGVSAASLMHLAWALVLARASARSQVVFGTVVFGRMQGGEQAELAMGLLINTLPVRVDIGSEGIEASLKRTHRLLVRLMRHEHAPLSLAQRCSAVDSQMPLFTALLNYRYTQAAHASAEQGSSDPADVIEELAGHERTNYPLTLSVDDSGTNFRLTAQVGGGIEARRICAFMQTALEELLRALRSAPQTGAHRIDVLPAEERRRLLGEWNDTKAAYPEDRCLHELFEEQASRTPEAVAVVFEGA